MNVVTRNKVEVVVYNKNNEIMILAPCERSPWWAIPGGGIDEGELPIDAVQRECKEEAGCSVKNVKKLFDSEFEGQYKGKLVKKLTYFYMAEFNKIDTSIFNADGDGRQAFWMTAQEAVSKLSDTEFDKPRADAILRTAQLIRSR